jgi:hypothetical protein
VPETSRDGDRHPAGQLSAHWKLSPASRLVANWSL